MKLSEAIVQIARHEIGTEEVNATNCGPRVDRYKSATNLPPHESWPWCAAFIDWCVMTAMETFGIPETQTFRRPTTASAFDLANWSLAQDTSTWTRRLPKADIESGDIIIYQFSHCGIATRGPDDQGFFTAIEGNTNGQGSREGGAVLEKRRHISKVRARIRFRI